jgi:hypothetical protein
MSPMSVAIVLFALVSNCTHDDVLADDFKQHHIPGARR